MKQFEEIYRLNKELDQLFINSYESNNEENLYKNKLELLVELGELCNETKCFKYWSVKLPDKEKVSEEFADCILMILCLFSVLNISLEEEFIKENDLNVMDEFFYLYQKISLIDHEFNKDNMKNIFVNIIRLGHLLKMSDKDIIDACMKKIKINTKRFEENY